MKYEIIRMEYKEGWAQIHPSFFVWSPCEDALIKY